MIPRAREFEVVVRASMRLRQVLTRTLYSGLAVLFLKVIPGALSIGWKVLLAALSKNYISPFHEPRQLD